MNNQLKSGHGEEYDPILESALRGFRDSVHAWSESAYNRPRPAIAAAQRTAWRRGIVWALSLAVSVGIVGTAGYERHEHDQAVARQQQLQQERQRQQAAEKARDTEELLANIDSDISREQPAAMEPLAQLMTDDQ